MYPTILSANSQDPAEIDLNSNTVKCGNLLFGYVIKCFFPGRVQVQSRETSKFKSV